jgi:PAS domain S-box-containing protein
MRLAMRRDARGATPVTSDSVHARQNLREIAGVGFALTLLVLLVGAVLATVNLRHLSRSQAEVAHSYEVMGQLDAVLSNVTDAETGQRGYLLTQEERYLDPYDEGLTRLDDTLGRLRRMTADDRDQQARLGRLEQKIGLKLEELKRTVALMKRGDRPVALDIVHSDEGKRLMDDVREVVAVMRGAEQDVLERRGHQTEVRYRTALLSILIPAVVGVILVGLVFYLSRRNLLIRRRAAESLAEERERLRVTLASVGDAVITTNADGRIRYLNAVAESVTGWRLDDAVGRPLADVFRVVDEQTRAPAPDPVQTVLRDGVIAPLADNSALVRKDRAERPIDASAAPIRSVAGQPIGCVLTFRDITTRRRAEAEREELLAIAQRARADAEVAATDERAARGRAETAAEAEREARQAAEDASRAKDAFLATVSHELRTPLSPILTWTRVLRQGDTSPERIAQGIGVIDRCARSQAQLIEDLLDVSRIVAGKMRLEVRPVMVAPVIERAVDIVRPAADAKDVGLQMVLDTEVGAVLGDAERLQQVVWNLVSNAVKFTPKGGRVQVALERVNSHIEIAVSDTGQGIDPGFLPHMFERFQQGDAGPSRAHGGLGLGLAIVRHIVEAHGGTVHAESPGPGRGAVFTVKLPLMMARRAGELERRHPTVGAVADGRELQRLDGLRILVVDDEPDSNDAVSELLASCGADVRAAASADEARDVLARWRPDVLVSDVGMPGEDGYAFIARLRANEGDRAPMPAVALTAYASRDDKVRLLSAGFQAHVPKPLDPNELVAVIASLVGARRGDFAPDRGTRKRAAKP